MHFKKKNYNTNGTQCTFDRLYELIQILNIPTRKAKQKIYKTTKLRHLSFPKTGFKSDSYNQVLLIIINNSILYSIIK